MDPVSPADVAIVVQKESNQSLHSAVSRSSSNSHHEHTATTSTPSTFSAVTAVDSVHSPHSEQNIVDSDCSDNGHSDGSNASSLNSVPAASIPTVHAVLVFTKSDDKTERVRLVDAAANALNVEMAKMSKTDDLMSYAKAFAFARPSGSFLKLQGFPNCPDYAMYTLDVSDLDTATFVVDEDPVLLQQVEMDKEDGALTVLPFIDGALTRFLRRAQVYGVGDVQSVEWLSMYRYSVSIRVTTLKSDHFQK